MKEYISFRDQKWSEGKRWGIGHKINRMWRVVCESQMPIAIKKRKEIQVPLDISCDCFRIMGDGRPDLTFPHIFGQRVRSEYQYSCP